MREDRVLAEDVGLLVLAAVLLLLLSSRFSVVLLPVDFAFLVVCVSPSSSSAFRFFLTMTNPSNAAFLELPAEDRRWGGGFLVAAVVVVVVVTVAGNSGAVVRVCSTALVGC